jgi:hypothetical protein
MEVSRNRRRRNKLVLWIAIDVRMAQVNLSCGQITKKELVASFKTCQADDDAQHCHSPLHLQFIRHA